MSFLENNLYRRVVILASGILSIPVAYAMDSMVSTPHPFYQAWIILSIALWVIISGIVYFVFLSLRMGGGAPKTGIPPKNR